MARATHRSLWQVRIYRLITDKTYEKGMFERACLKLSLDQAVLGGGGGGGGEKEKAEPSQAELSKLLRCGARRRMVAHPWRNLALISRTSRVNLAQSRAHLVPRSLLLARAPDASTGPRCAVSLVH
eukprot:2081534-Prymnesium_polylepis.1